MTCASLHTIDNLFAAYGQVLDEQQFERWPALFADECEYSVYSLENLERGLPLAYMLDDCRARVVDRVKVIREVWAGTVESYRTRHLIQRTEVRDLDSAACFCKATMLVSFTQRDGQAGLLASGYYEARIQLAEQGARFGSLRAVMDNLPPRYLVYPL